MNPSDDHRPLPPVVRSVIRFLQAEGQRRRDSFVDDVMDKLWMTVLSGIGVKNSGICVTRREKNDTQFLVKFECRPFPSSLRTFVRSSLNFLHQSFTELSFMIRNVIDDECRRCCVLLFAENKNDNNDDQN